MSIKNPEHLRKMGTPELDKYNQAEKESHVDEKETAPTAETRAEEDQKEFNLRLADLKMAVAEMEKHNKNSVGGPKEEITEEIFENIMNMPVSEFMEYANGGKNINKPDLRSVHNQVSGVINGEFNEEYKGSSFRQVMNKPMTKVFFAAFCLFLKFGVHAQAHEATVKENPDSGHKIGTNFDGGGKTPQLDRENAKDTYKLNPHATALEGLKEVSTLDILQSFETDKANISKTDSLDITNKINKFLDKVDKHTIKDFKEARKVVEVSSDERATKFGSEDKKAAPTLEGNIPLSKARAAKAASIAELAFKTHDYSKSDLPAKDVKEMQNTKVETKIPAKGFTKITELNKINPATGKIYTEKDVENMKTSKDADVKALYNDLLKECRYAKINLMVESAFQRVSQGDRLLLFVDNSPSTEYTMNYTANKFQERGLEENSKGNIAKVDLVYYTDDASQVKHLPNILAAADDLRHNHIKQSSIENPFKSSINYLKNLISQDKETKKTGGEIEDHREAIFTTDEGLQEAQHIFEAVELLKEAQVKNATIALYSPNAPKPLEKDLFGMANEIQKSIETKMELDKTILEQTKQSAEKTLNDLISQANAKVSPKLLNEFFGQEKISNEKGALKILDSDNQKLHKLQGEKRPGEEKMILYKLFEAIKNLEKNNESLNKVNTQTFKDYLNTTQIEIKTFTDNSGKKVAFDVLGYERLDKDIKRQSINL
ncbi:MAG: hypothetical protein ACYC40_00705 [Patescibacteria group bacterium]